MFDVEDILFEANGAVTVISNNKTDESYLLVNNGEIVKSGLARSNRSQAWVLRNIKRNGFESPAELFCMEWTPNKGFYFVTYAGDVKRGKEEIAADAIEIEAQT